MPTFELRGTFDFVQALVYQTEIHSHPIPLPSLSN